MTDNRLDQSNPLFGVMSDIVRGDGAWITWYLDADTQIRIITGIHATELDALRIANTTETRATQIPYGANPQMHESLEP